MMKKMDEKLIELQTRLYCLLQDFSEEERGESNFVAIILIILIAVGIAFVFKDRVIQLVNNVFDNIDTNGLSSH